MKYQTYECTGFWLDEHQNKTKVDFMHVRVAKGEWDGEEDADDERIFYYMDGRELSVGDIISDGFVVIEIEENNDA